ncbi:hypothetical protein [Bradymonas sediminis]|nr:hypothetical protein [Bradymonas sediminis]TDP63552.1 hypothetical protein DFR33_1109 [Bradymonas sediminis]
MDTTQFFEQANDVVGSLFSGGSRYQIEKVVTVVVYVVISAASLVWAFSGEGAANQLDASFVVGQLSEIDDQNLHLINNGKDWSTVRVVLNKKYLWTAPAVKANSQVTLNPEDFNYYYHIPRSWGRQGWEKLATTEKLPAGAPGTLKIKEVGIWAREGRSDMKIGLDGKPVPAGGAKAERPASAEREAAESP